MAHCGEDESSGMDWLDVQIPLLYSPITYLQQFLGLIAAWS
jgi:hypothetical protein